MAEAGEFQDRVAFVTGGGSGIGRATAEAFAAAGAAVVVADVDESSAAETARRIETAGGSALAVRCDVADADDVQAALQAAVDRFGGIGFAFNNAGVE